VRRTVARLERHAVAAGVRPHVEFLGAVPPEALRALYAEASVLALASRYENFGMVVLEALRAGCPVVASRETPWEVLDESGAGRWVDFDAPDGAARALLEVGADPAAPARARALFDRRFSPAVVVPQFRAWYERVVRDARSASAA
jgi:glycosyltransferase involved in cell wall biosynthesis